MHLVELQHMLDEARRKEGRIRPYSASVRWQKDVESLSQIGMTPEDISYSLDLPLSLVRSHKARIESEKAARRRFLQTFTLRTPEPGVVSILQK